MRIQTKLGRHMVQQHKTYVGLTAKEWGLLALGAFILFGGLGL